MATTSMKVRGDEFANHMDVSALWDTYLDVYGFSGDDVIVAHGQGNLQMILMGGAGDDFLRTTELVVNAGWAVVLDGGAGADTMVGGGSDEVFHVGQHGDVIRDEGTDDWDHVVTTLRHFTLPVDFNGLSHEGHLDFRGGGNSLDNRLSSGAGNDILRGFAGDDDLYAGANGTDTLVGGLGADSLNASWAEHSVTLQYNRTADSRGKFGTDEVIYLGPNDRIDLSRIDADTSTPGRNEAFTFIGTEAFSAVATGQVRYERLGDWRTMVLVSTDADPHAEMRIIFEDDLLNFTQAMFVL